MVQVAHDSSIRQPNGWYCGPAATAVAMSAHSGPTDQDFLAAQLGTTVNGTNSVRDVQRVLNGHISGSYECIFIPGDTASPDEVAALRLNLKSSLDSGWVVVANVRGSIHTQDGSNYSYPSGHFVAIVGYSMDDCLVLDVDKREYWITIPQLALWIASRGYTYSSQVTPQDSSYVGRELLDYSFSRPNLDEVVSQGYIGVMRYLSWDTPAAHGKIADVNEVAAIRGRGLALGLNWEYAEGDALRGYAGGVADATEAKSQAKSLGYPEGLGIVFSADWNVPDYELETVASYFLGVDQVMAGTYKVGVYGSYKVVKFLLDRGIVDYGWQAKAWSDDDVDERAVLYQYQNNVTVAGAQVDLNVIKGDLPIWGLVSGEPEVKEDEEDMKPYAFTAQDANTIVVVWLHPDHGLVRQNVGSSAWVGHVDGLPHVNLPVNEYVTGIGRDYVELSP